MVHVSLLGRHILYNYVYSVTMATIVTKDFCTRYG